MSASKRPLIPALAILVAMFWPSSLRAEVDRTALDEARAGNKFAIESIRTLSCRVTLSSSTPPKGAMAQSAAEYWWSDGASRIRTLSAGQQLDSVVKDSVARIFVQGHDARGRELSRFRIVRIDPATPHTVSDPWGAGLLKLCGPKGWPLTLEQLLSGPHQLLEAHRVTESGRMFVVLKFSIELSPANEGEFEVWFDPRANYLASKLIGISIGPDSGGIQERRESRVVRFVEAAPAIYFPEVTETLHYKNSEVVARQEARFSNLRLNEPLPANIFDIKAPPGSEVFDEIENKSYRLDDAGKYAGPGIPIGRFPPLPASDGEFNATEHEPTPATRWVLPGAIILLVVATGFWLVKKWHSK